MDMTTVSSYNVSLLDLNSTINGTGNATYGNATDEMISKGPSPLKIAFDVVIKLALIIIMFGMGCTIEIDPLIQHLRRPIGIAIGMASQFLVLPLVTFGLAHALTLPDMAALGMLVVGCCPGGSTSNIFTYWVDGDVALSISMTTVSTVLAFGMMPLNIWIYSRSWTSGSLFIPYVNILISLVMTIGPALVGIFMRWKLPKVANVCVKCGSVAGVLSVILTLVLLSLLYPFMYNAPWNIYLGSILLPFCGFGFGYIVSLIFGMKGSYRRTVALETGIQNFPLCMTLMTMTFKTSRFADIALFPLLYGITCIVCSVIFLVAYRAINRIKSGRKQSKRKDDDEDVDMKFVNRVLNGNDPSKKPRNAEVREEFLSPYDSATN